MRKVVLVQGTIVVLLPGVGHLVLVSGTTKGVVLQEVIHLRDLARPAVPTQLGPTTAGTSCHLLLRVQFQLDLGLSPVNHLSCQSGLLTTSNFLLLVLVRVLESLVHPLGWVVASLDRSVLVFDE